MASSFSCPCLKGLDEHVVTAAIAPEKDADGLHVLNLGALTAGTPAPRPCTPFGCIQLLKHAGVEMSGKHAVVIGRSTIVGKPMALLLLAEKMRPLLFAIHAHRTLKKRSAGLISSSRQWGVQRWSRARG